MPRRTESWLASLRATRTVVDRDRQISAHPGFGAIRRQVWCSLVLAAFASLFVSAPQQASAEGGGRLKPIVRSATELERGRAVSRRASVRPRMRLPDGGNRRLKLATSPDDAERASYSVLVKIAAMIGVGLLVIVVFGLRAHQRWPVLGGSWSWFAGGSAARARRLSHSLQIMGPMAPRLSAVQSKIVIGD